MPSELLLDPDRLHVHGRRLSALLADLAPLPWVDAATRDGLAATPGGPAVLAELDRAAAAVDRAGRELAALAAALHVAAYAAAAADDAATAGLAALTDRP
ncbi:hypothetical protein GCM10017691_52860 [Pseudonocardia petroleophila]|uniref:Excreted virulence factor EspC, type VII ESX diderm n=1 Tax=Pseudonocardia petroleophila TaxID=37331 RepID=A0A7G7MPA0_9PSEU|nr:hypothetical protein [Pseudonocardia petroleophila]QNG54611.1 hypothetical protein H6H00_12405 [Pseudonocardia petroleophila]